MIETKTINQSELTTECWLVQFNGLGACKTCDLKGTSDCGGKEVRKKLENDKGYAVPLGGE